MRGKVLAMMAMINSYGSIRYNKARSLGILSSYRYSEWRSICKKLLAIPGIVMIDSEEIGSLYYAKANRERIVQVSDGGDLRDLQLSKTKSTNALHHVGGTSSQESLRKLIYGEDE